MADSTEMLANLDPLADIATVDLGDRRRNERFGLIVEALLHQPDRSVPQVCEDEAACEAYYRFNRNPNVEDEALFSPHFEASARRAEKLEHVLCHHDTTEFSFPVHNGEIRENLAHPSTNRQGFLWHASLVTSADGLRAPVGLVAAKAFVHKNDLPDEAGEAFWQERQGLYENEKWRWYDNVEAAEQQLGEVAQVTHVFDREFDDFQMLFCMAVDEYEFVARACYDRKVSTGARRKDYQRLKQALSECVWRGRRQVELSPRSAAQADACHPARRRRTATLKARSKTVELRRPDSVPAQSAPARIQVNAVEVKELHPPAGEAPVYWLLLTSRPVDTLEQIWEVVDTYRARWSIEEFFKALKTGCGYQKLQHRNAKTLLCALAQHAVVAHYLLVLRHLGRNAHDMPAEVALSAAQIQILAALLPKYLSARPTVGEAMLAVARLGGHLSSNGHPGWQVLGRGWQRLMEYERAFALGLQAQREL